MAANKKGSRRQEKPRARNRDASLAPSESSAKKRKDPAAVSLGRRGGHATAKKLSKKSREERARAGAIARWKKAKGKDYQPPP